MNEFYRIKLLPQYIFNGLADMKAEAESRGEEILDFGMGNPDLPTPPHIVDTLIEAAKKPENHRYSLSKGIAPLRTAICDWYQQHYQAELDPEKEAIVTIGSKEGIAHLALAITGPGDIALVPSPAYPIHTYAFIIAGAEVKHVSLMGNQQDIFNKIKVAIEGSNPIPKILVLNFPSNPTTQCVEVSFFEEIIALAKQYGIWVLHDLAYADIVFDDYKAPSILQVKGAKEVAVECYTLSKSYNMPGWRVGFMCGNDRLITALTKMKSYLDYGMFAPIQLAAITALTSGPESIKEICAVYKKRRDLLCAGLQQTQWEFAIPRASMFVWARIPETYRHLGSFEFSKQLLLKAGVSVSPGIGFGPFGDEYVRFSLIEDEPKISKAIMNMAQMFKMDTVAVT
ncbi:MAG: aminotransferase class I/II-fold pyridoxal phosphate-dependent enzyme [Gammaproteobacteria bacterium]|nr:aminotransferase class I/II-fold pyridoxal phosphate-dependent enzyme [Gammaproteobacteria bacterium]